MSASGIDGVGSRHLLLLLLVAAGYLVFCGALLQTGNLRTSTSAFALFCVIWGAGFALALITLTPRLPLTISTSQADLLLALWCNVGITTSAVLLGGSLRIMLLAGAVFGVFYGALHLNKAQVRLISGATVASYLAALAVLATRQPLNVDYEFLSLISLGAMLLGAHFVGREVIGMRTAAASRQAELSYALARVEELALRDDLTGLYNRRHLLDVLRGQLAQVDRGGMNFVVCYCDLDHFKRVNDRFGHACGDALLCKFAQTARGTVRTQDLVARLGGEEFVLVLSACDVAEAEVIVERLRRRTAALNVHASAADFRITLSVGIAVNVGDDSVEDLLRRADRALYLAKARGRDCLVVATREPVDK